MFKDELNLRQRIVREKRRHTEPSSGGSKERSKKHILPLPTSYFLALLLLIAVVLTAVIVIEKQLPPGLKIAEEHRYPNRFIAERAYNQLRNLTSLGPRIAGSHENEVLAVNLLKREVGEIIRNAKDNNVIQLDVQKVSGSFALKFLDGMTNVYSNLQNVVIKVGSHINSPHSLLINCHFDTVVDSPGASDDGAGCAVMLEMLRVISQSDRILRHNIIFLFNGGEENFLPASHGFITQHKWANEVRAFINLEACGAGGREVLFQAGPNHPWIIETYAEEVPYPYASSLAQEIFQSGVIPGDTDYRIFRDFGNLSGLDFAWSANGYVYHTKFDSIEQIPLGSLQRTGDNILALARGMAQGHQLSNIESHRAGNLVFFDFLGAFVKILNGMGGVIGIWLASILAAAVVALVLTALGRTMAWYGRPLWVFFLYMVPTFLVSMAATLIHAKYNHKDIDVWPWTVFQIYYDAYQSVWTVVLLLGTILRIRSSFIALLWVMFAATGSLLKSKVFKKIKDGKWLLLHIGALGLPFVQAFYLLIGALYLFIPIMGRAGAGINSEVLISVMVSFLFVLLISFATPVILLVRDAHRVFSLLLGMFLLSVAVLLLTPLGFPYSGDPNSLAPQRFMLSHTRRTFHDISGSVKESSGFWIIDFDMNSPHTVDRYVPEMQSAQLVDKDCVDYLYCGLPYLVPVLSMLWKTHWIPGSAPDFDVPVRMNILRREKTEIGERFVIQVEGPSHVGVMLSPVSGVDLDSWSFKDEPLLASVPWNNRKTYFVFYATGVDPVPLKFSLDFKVSKDHEGPIVDLAVTGHYMFGKSKHSPEYKKFVDQFPPWAAVTSWSASYESWVL